MNLSPSAEQAPKIVATSGFLHQKTVQIHPTLRCNLQCEHCYSSSGPTQKSEIPWRRLSSALVTLRDEGFSVVSVSGGEPLIYPRFDELVTLSHDLGYKINFITNGTLLSERRIASWAERVSLVGVSLDGAPAQHDRIRGRAGAFKKVARNVKLLRDQGVPFAISYCATRDNLQDLPWLYKFAIEAGARGLQIHALNMAGRAENKTTMALHEADYARLYLLAEALRQQSPESFSIQLDLAPTNIVSETVQRLGTTLKYSGAAGNQLSQLVNPIVLDEFGNLSPFVYGIAPSYAVAKANSESYQDKILKWKIGEKQQLADLLRRSAEVADSASSVVVDWYDILARTSFQPSGYSQFKTGPNDVSSDAQRNLIVAQRSTSLVSKILRERSRGEEV